MPAALPWKEILKAAPYLAVAARKVWDQIGSKPKPPAVDPAADLRTQVAAVGERVQQIEAAQAEEAKVVSLLAEQVQAIARRSARGDRLAVVGMVLSVVALALSVWTALR